MNYGSLVIKNVKSISILDKNSNTIHKVDTPEWLKDIYINRTEDREENKGISYLLKRETEIVLDVENEQGEYEFTLLVEAFHKE